MRWKQKCIKSKKGLFDWFDKQKNKSQSRQMIFSRFFHKLKWNVSVNVCVCVGGFLKPAWLIGSLKQSLDTTDWHYKQDHFKGINNEAEMREYLLETSTETKHIASKNHTILSAVNWLQRHWFSLLVWRHEPLKVLKQQARNKWQTVCDAGRNLKATSGVWWSKYSLTLFLCLRVLSQRG